jgi:protein ImuB
MLWLCLHFPSLPLEIFTRSLCERGEDSAILVAEKHRVLCRNASAAAYGIAAGTSLSTAQALCEKLVALERHPPGEATALGNLAEWGYRFTPMLSVEPPDTLFLEIRGSVRLFGGLENLLRQVETELAERGFSHRAGIAPTAEGARLLARAASCTHAEIPDWCEKGDVPAFLARIAQLPLETLECTERQRHRMSQTGLSQVGELLELPRPAVGKRYGRPFLDYLRRLTGELPEFREAYRPADFFRSTLHFPEPLHDSGTLLFPMRRLLHELTQFLDRRQCHCQRFVWEFVDTEKQRYRLAIPCSLQHNSHDALLGLTRLGMESFRLGAAVETLVLLCRRFVHVQQQTATLFRGLDADGSEVNHDDADRLLLDRLAVRLGEHNIRGIEPSDSHLPEHAWTTVRGNTRRAHAEPTTVPSPERPFWLLRSPLRLLLRNGALYWQGRLQILTGPERIAAQWWDAIDERDYFIARQQNGAICWIFREHTSRRWFLHGMFG